MTICYIQDIKKYNNKMINKFNKKINIIFSKIFFTTYLSIITK